MAATWPSIIPLGATTWAPAAACTTARSAYSADGGVVVDLAGARDEHTAVPVVGELVETAVGHHHQVVTHRVAHGLECPPGDAVGREGGRTRRVLVLGPRQREEDDPGDAQADQAPDLLDEGGDRVLGDPGQ